MLPVAINTQHASTVLLWRGHCPVLHTIQRQLSPLNNLSFSTLARDSRVPRDAVLLDFTRWDQRAPGLRRGLQPTSPACGFACLSEQVPPLSLRFFQKNETFGDQWGALDSNLCSSQIPGWQSTVCLIQWGHKI